MTKILNRYERQKIKETDKFFAAKVRSIENRRNAENEALESFKKNEKKNHKKAVSITL